MEAKMARTKRTTKTKKSAISKKERYILSMTAAMAVVGTMGIWMLATSSAASCTVSDKLVDSCRPWVGVWAHNYPQVTSGKEQIAFHEQRVGKQADVIHTYHPAGNNKLNETEKTYYGRANTHLLINWKPTNDWKAAGGSNSTVNASIDQMAREIKSLGSKKVLFTVFHEPENDVSGGASGCTSYKGNLGTPAEYRAMWSNVRKRFDAQGVGNVVWVMNYMGFSQWDCMVDDLWPGNELVDWVLYDPYGNSKSNFDNAIGRFYNYLKNNSNSKQNFNSKPWGLGEYAIHGATDAQEKKFYEDAKASLEANRYPNLKLYTMFDSIGNLGDHRISYNAAGQYAPSSAEAYKRFINSDVFTRTSTSAPVSPTPSPNDTTPPSVRLTKPSNGAKVSGVVNMTASASDNKGVKAVSFIVNGTWHSTDSSAPFSGKLDTRKLKDGTHTIKARAWDTANLFKDGTTIKVTVANTSKAQESPSGGNTGQAPVKQGGPKRKVMNIGSIRQLARGGQAPVDAIIKVEPSKPGQKVEVKVNGTIVKDNTVDTTKLTDGTHQIAVTENGVTETASFEVDNPWHVAVRNEVASKPVAYAAGGGGSIAALFGGGFIMLRRFGWPF